MAIPSLKAIAALTLIVSAVIWSAATSQPDGKVHIWVIGSKRDFSLIIRSQEGQTALVNPKSDPVFLEILGKKLPFFDRNLALVVLTSPGESSRSSLDTLTNRYKLAEVWVPDSHPTYSKDIKMIQNLGWEERERVGLSWQTWQVPGEIGMVRLSKNLISLLMIGKSRSELWSSWPSETTSALLVGPSAQGGTWPGQPLLSQFKPDLVITDDRIETVDHLVGGEVEIVWDRDSWYINPNP